MVDIPRQTQEVVEVVRESDAPSPRLTQETVEVVRESTTPSPRLTQLVVEVLRKADAPITRATGYNVQVLRAIPPPQDVRISQAIVEVARVEPPSEAALSQVVLEVARPARGQPRPGLPSWMVFDQDHSLDIRMFAGNPPTSAAADLNVLNGENIGLLGKEIFQWVTATDLGNNVFRLSRLLRGRLGTEKFMNSHSTNELFVILDVDSVRRVVQDNVDFNVLRFLRVVGAGFPAFSAPTSTFINTGFNLQPWQAVHVTTSRDIDGNVTISWFRRTRVGIEWLDGADVGIGEESERYEVDILDASGAVVGLPLESTTPSVVYTDTRQNDDFGGLQATIAFAIYQLSNTVGRGQPSFNIG